MTEGRQVAPFWADGLLCPHCGRPLRWLGEWHGPRFVRKPMEVLAGRRISTADEPERVPVGQSGLEVRTELRFRHVVSLECVPCCKLYSEDQARRGRCRTTSIRRATSSQGTSSRSTVQTACKRAPQERAMGTRRRRSSGHLVRAWQEWRCQIRTDYQIQEEEEPFEGRKEKRWTEGSRHT